MPRGECSPRQRGHFVTDLEVAAGRGQETLDAAGADHAPFVIQLQTHQIDVAHLHRLVLLTAGHKQILFHAPVEESTNLVGIDHFQTGKFVHHGKWLVSGDHRLAIGIQIEEDLHAIPLFHPFRQLTLGQQQFTVLIGRKPGAAIFEFNNGEGVHLANLYHGALFSHYPDGPIDHGPYGRACYLKSGDPA